MELFFTGRKIMKKQYPQTSVSIPIPLQNSVKLQAKNDHRSFSAQCVYLIELGLKATTKKA